MLVCATWMVTADEGMHAFCFGQSISTLVLLITVTVAQFCSCHSFCIWYEPAVPVMPLHCSLQLNVQQLTCRYCNIVQCRVYVDINITKEQYTARFTQAWWHFAWPVQLCFLSWLNSFISCVCTFHLPVFIGNLHGRQQNAVELFKACHFLWHNKD